MEQTSPQTDNEQDNHPELLKQTEEFFFLFQHELTQDAKNTIWRFLNLAKQAYGDSPHKEEWNVMLKNLQTVINDFHNDYSSKSEIKLAAMHKNAEELKEEDSRAA